MFLCGIGVPLSWGKLRVGQCLVWIGWKFHADTCQASLPAAKVAKAFEALRPWLRNGSKVERRQVKKLCGISWVVLWRGFLASCLAGMAALYKLLHKPQAVTRLLHVDDFFSFVQVLGQDLRVTWSLLPCDICAGWKLHSVNSEVISSLQSVAVFSPRIRRGSYCTTTVARPVWCQSRRPLCFAMPFLSARLFFRSNLLRPHRAWLLPMHWRTLSRQAWEVGG